MCAVWPLSATAIVCVFVSGNSGAPEARYTMALREPSAVHGYVAVPSGVTTVIGPLVAPDGTVAVSLVSSVTVNEDALSPANWTSVAFVKSQATDYETAKKTDARELALTDFCQTLMCLNEFVYVD